MARIESLALGGFYAFPNEYVPRVAALIDASGTNEGERTRYGYSTYGTYMIMDPCAGEGEAVLNLMKSWWKDLPGALPNVYLYAVELETRRFKKLEENIKKIYESDYGRYNLNKALNGDAFSVSWANAYSSQQGAQVLWLNPPYDTHKAYGRLEQKFLERYTEALVPGSGILIYIIPFYALKQSAEFLAEHYEDITCWKLPEPDFEKNFKQAILIANRREVANPFPDPGQIAQINRWADDSDTIPVLPERHTARPRYFMPPKQNNCGFQSFEMQHLDVKSLKENTHPWVVGGLSKKKNKKLPERSKNTATSRLMKDAKSAVNAGMDKAKAFWSEFTAAKEVGLHLGMKDFVGRPWNVAMPPKLAHIAMALASGMFNGKVVSPNAEIAEHMPDIIIKGVFKKDFVTIEEKFDSKGKKKSEIKIQQPVLQVSIREMKTYKAYELKSGAEPTGSRDLGEMNIADLIAYYGEGLTNLMMKQFPAMHDPFNPGHQMELPVLGRKLFRAQHQIVQAAIKQMYVIGDSLIMGEVGTGKSTMAMYTIGAFNRDNFDETIKKLQVLGLDQERAGQPFAVKDVKPVDSALVLCPPHLKKSWADQVSYTLPGARVIQLESIPDIFKVTGKELAEFNPRNIDMSQGPEHFAWMKKKAAEYQQKKGLPGYGMTIYVLTRENAKLGGEDRSGSWLVREYTEKVEVKDKDGNIELVEKTFQVRLCPKCGYPLSREDKSESDERLKDAHARCTYTPVRPSNEAGRVAVELAQYLRKVMPEDEIVRGFTKGRFAQMSLAKQREAINFELVRRISKAEKVLGKGKANEDTISAELRRDLWLEQVVPNLKRAFRLGMDGAVSNRGVAYGSHSLTFKATEYDLVERLVSYIEKQMPKILKETSGSWLANDHPYQRVFDALLALVASLPYDEKLISHIANRLFDYSLNVQVEVKDDKGEVVNTYLGSNNNNVGYIARVSCYKLALMLEPESEAQKRLLTKFRQLSNLCSSQVSDTLNYLELAHAKYLQLKTGQLDMDGALTLISRNRQGKWYLWNDLTFNLHTGRVDFNGHEAGSHAPAVAALTQLMHVGGFKKGANFGPVSTRRYHDASLDQSENICGEMLWQQQPISRNYVEGYAANEPGSMQLPLNNKTKLNRGYYSSGKYPLARYISRFKKDLFDVLICDELHEYNNATQGSAQGIAFHRLAQLGKPIIGLTGSLMGGYASSLFSASQALFESFRQEFTREQKEEFVRRYGYLKVEVMGDGDDDNGDVLGYGSRSERRDVGESKMLKKGEAPGILPLFTVQYLLRYALFIHKEDLDEALPVLNEYPVKIRPDADDLLGRKLLSNFNKLQTEVMTEIKNNLFTPGKAGKLYGALAELMSALDLCHEETGNCEVVGKNEAGKTVKRRAYQVRYPDFLDAKGVKHQGQLVAEMPLLPNSYITPKEQWMLDQIKEQLDNDRPVMVYLRHTGKGGSLVKRLSRLIKENVDGLGDYQWEGEDEKGNLITEKRSRVAFLDSNKVGTSIREQWINDEIIGKGVKVLLVNATTVQTGLNNLVYFPVVIWYESTYNAYTYRQANGRVHRIGQSQEVDLFATFYAGTTQEIAVDLLARKVTASLQVDGLSVEGALQAAGAEAAEDGGEYLDKVSATNIGKAIFAQLQKRQAELVGAR